MSTPAVIRAALASYIEANVEGLRVLTDPGSIANPPVAVILPAQGTYIDYTVALEHGVYEINVRVVILVSRASERIALPLLDDYLDPATGVPAAILKDPTLGGAVDYCIPQEAIVAGDISWAGVDYFGAEIICRAGAE
jgi:hypothetical protein